MGVHVHVCMCVYGVYQGPDVGHERGERERDAGGDEEDLAGLVGPEPVLARAGAVGCWCGVVVLVCESVRVMSYASAFQAPITKAHLKSVRKSEIDTLR